VFGPIAISCICCSDTSNKSSIRNSACTANAQRVGMVLKDVAIQLV